VSNPVFPGLRVELLDQRSVSLSSDIIAILDRADSKTIRFLDASSGRPLAGSAGKLVHHLEITEIQLSQMENPFTRLVAFTDKVRFILYLCIYVSRYLCIYHLPESRLVSKQINKL
jgi:hypothetical protein